MLFRIQPHQSFQCNPCVVRDNIVVNQEGLGRSVYSQAGHIAGFDRFDGCDTLTDSAVIDIGPENELVIVGRCVVTQ